MNPITTSGAATRGFLSFPPDILNHIVMRCGARGTAEWKAVLLSLVSVQNGVEDLFRPQITEVRLGKRLDVLDKMREPELPAHFQQVCAYFDNVRSHLQNPYSRMVLNRFARLIRKLPEGEKSAEFAALCTRLAHADIGKKECASVLLNMAVGLKPQFDAPSAPHGTLLQQIDALDQHHIAFASKAAGFFSEPKKSVQTLVGLLRIFLGDAAALSETEAAVKLALQSLRGCSWSTLIANELLNFGTPSPVQRSARLTALMQAQANNADLKPGHRDQVLSAALRVWCAGSKGGEPAEKGEFFKQAFLIIDKLALKPEGVYLYQTAHAGCLLFQEFCEWHEKHGSSQPELAYSMLDVVKGLQLASALLTGVGGGGNQLYRLLSRLINDERFQLANIQDVVRILGVYHIVAVTMPDAQCLRLLHHLAARLEEIFLASGFSCDLDVPAPDCGPEALSDFFIQMTKSLQQYLEHDLARLLAGPRLVASSEENT